MRISIHYSNEIVPEVENYSSDVDDSDDDDDDEEEDIEEIQPPFETIGETTTITNTNIEIEASRLAKEIVLGGGAADRTISSDHFISLVLDDMIGFAHHPKNILRTTPDTLIDVIKTTLCEFYQSREVIDFMSKLYSDYILSGHSK